MLGQPIGAKEALRIGLVTRWPHRRNSSRRPSRWPGEMANRSPETIEAVKRISDVAPRLDKVSALDLELDVEARLFRLPKDKGVCTNL